MASDTPPVNFEPRMAISLTRLEAVVLIEYLRRLRAGELEGLYKDMKNMARRRGWGPVVPNAVQDEPGAFDSA